MTPDVAQLLETAGLPAVLTLAFGGGLLLSLTPCVYPMIPITVAAFGARRVGRARSFVLSLCYVVGIATAYSALGTWAAATGGLFGAALADPRVTAGFAVLFAFLAGVSFGWFPAVEGFLSRTPGWAVRGRGSSFVGALTMGLGAGVLFAPCVGPAVVGALAYVASTGDMALGGLLLATVGLGMGAPFVGLALLSGELARLPRARALPDLARFLVGVALLVAALYYLRLSVPPQPFRLIAAGALLLLGAERLVRARRTQPHLWIGAGTCAVGLAALLIFLPPSRPGATPLVWRTDVEAALDQARAAGRFAVIDFTAEWCLACHELERVTFSHPAVAQLLQGAERIRVDATRMNERVERLFARFGVLGLPAVVVLDPRGSVVEEARVTSFVPPGQMSQLLHRAGLAPPPT